MGPMIAGPLFPQLVPASHPPFNTYQPCTGTACYPTSTRSTNACAPSKASRCRCLLPVHCLQTGQSQNIADNAVKYLILTMTLRARLLLRGIIVEALVCVGTMILRRRKAHSLIVLRCRTGNEEVSTIGVLWPSAREALHSSSMPTVWAVLLL